MRRFALFVAVASLAVSAAAQSCPAGTSTSLSGTVYAPNGTDPVPNVIVYIPGTDPGPLAPGISCPVPGQAPPGNPIAGAITATDGTFTLSNVPVGANIPLVIQAGKWRRQITVPGTVSCANTVVDPSQSRMPRNQTEGDIPKIAIGAASADSVECVLRKVGIDDSEFTPPTGTGRIHLYKASGSAGAFIDPTEPTIDLMMANPATLNGYDVLMLPCEGSAYTKQAPPMANLIAYADAGGRVYASHFSYTWLYRNGAFANVVHWSVNQPQLRDGTATIDVSFAGGQTLAEWLQLVHATTTQGQIDLSTLRHDQNGVIAPTQSWMTLNSSGSPVMQFTFNTPVGATNQCGRVLFDEYHVENNPGAGLVFPAECGSGTAMTPQEKLMEFTLFDLTGSGGQPTLAPTSQDFGSQPVSFAGATKTFHWTNNSIFPASVTSISATGDFSVISNTCSAPVAAGASCSIGVAFTPAALGARTGQLSVASSAETLNAALTGTGVPDLTLTPSSLAFGNLDVGASASQPITVTNIASGTVSVPGFTVSGDYSYTSTCGPTLAANASCAVKLIFTPTATGARNGTFATASSDAGTTGLQTTATGTGVDFSIAIKPTSGSVIAGHTISATLTLTPLGGFHAPISLSCPTAASAAPCVPATANFILSEAMQEDVAVSTVSKYYVIGYSGLGGRSVGLLWLIALGSGCLLWRRRHAAHMWLRAGVWMLLLAAGSLSLSSCSGHLPDQNNPYSPAGTYTYTVSATDGTLTHTATYTLTITVN